MRNNIKRAVCIITAFVAFMSMWGCTVKSGKTGKDSKEGGQLIDYSELATVNGTAAVTYKYTDADGKEQTEKVDIDMDIADHVELVSTRDITSDRFLNGIAQKGYQMNESKAKEVASNPNDYHEFQFVEYVQNSSDKTMAYKSVRVPENGKNGIWINTALDAEFTMIPGGVTPVYVYGIADMKKYDKESLEKEFKNIKIQLEYVLTDSAQDDIDWETADVKTIDIH